MAWHGMANQGGMFGYVVQLTEAENSLSPRCIVLTHTFVVTKLCMKSSRCHIFCAICSARFGAVLRALLRWFRGLFGW